MAGVAAAPQVVVHAAAPVHVVLQSPSHFTEQVEKSAQATMLPTPSCSLQFELALQTTLALVPSLKSQVVLPVQVSLLESPPAPLHADESLQVNVSAPEVCPWHLVPEVQLSAQSPVPQSVLQSVPAAQVQAVSTHAHPVPLQTGAAPSLPQAAAAANVITNSANPVPFLIARTYSQFPRHANHFHP